MSDIETKLEVLGKMRGAKLAERAARNKEFGEDLD